MSERTRAWNDFRLGLGGLVSALRSDLVAQAPRAAEELVAAAPRLKARVSDRIAAAAPRMVEGLWVAAPHLVRRSRRPALAAGPLGVLSVFAGGALVMHYCDPERGPARRRIGGQRIVTAVRFGTTQVRRAYRLAVGGPHHPTSQVGPVATAVRETSVQASGASEDGEHAQRTGDAGTNAAPERPTARPKARPTPATRPRVSPR